MTDLKSSYKILFFDKTLPCGNCRQYNGCLSIIFHILHKSPFSLLIIIISEVFFGDKNIKIGHSVFQTITA